MARRGRRKLLVTGAEAGVTAFKGEVMQRMGYPVDPARPDDVKYEVAEELGIPLSPSGNGEIRTEDAGKIGGRIGGTMVREMIRLAQERLAQRQDT